MTIRKISRRQLVTGAGFTAAGFVLGFAAKSVYPPAPAPQLQSVTNPDEALQRLLEGNQRFITGSLIHPNQSTLAQVRQELANGQMPWTTILGCIDSRVPPEIVFDQGLGDLFVARTAGQVIDDAVLGSIEYTVEEGAKLIVVLGHQSCGAVKATIDTLKQNGHADGHIAALVQAITPAVEMASTQPGDLIDNAVRANVILEVQQLVSSSDIISHAVQDGSIKLAGARYDLSTGAVQVLT